MGASDLTRQMKENNDQNDMRSKFKTPQIGMDNEESYDDEVSSDEQDEGIYVDMNNIPYNDLTDEKSRIKSYKAGSVP